MRAKLLGLLIFLATASRAQTQPAPTPQPTPALDSILRTVDQIKRADYEGDRPALKRLHAELALPSPANKTVASRVLYWRGFALWRRTINGFNETVPKNEQEDDLNAAIADFNDSLARDPAFVDSKIAEASCYGYLFYLNMKDPARSQEMIQHSSPLLKEAMASDPDNPRLLWVLGPIRWASPPERGGGQDKAFALYDRGLEIIRKKPAATDPLEPAWGEPELLMNRAWSNLNRTTPDLKAAQKDAESALLLVPHWHYVRDILLPQIQAAQAKAK
jgi:tetratricopeptide (TPR) repeat protein